jgi:hypothetical protein
VKKRIALGLFIFLLLIPSLYWIPVNLFLMARGIPSLASEGEGKSFNVTYTGAWSFFPGVVHVYGLHLDGTDPNVRWDVKIQSTTLHHSIRELFHRQVLVQKMDASGVWVKIRQHLESEKPEVLEKLGPPKPTLPTDPLPWKLSIHGIHLQNFHHAELDDIRFNGKSEIIGDFTLLPGRELEIKPSEWKIEQGNLSSQDAPIFTEMSGSSLVTIHPTDLTQTHGSEVFHTMDILHSLEAKVLSTDFFGLVYRPYQNRVKGRTEGTVSTHFDIQKGILQPGSTIQSKLSEIHLALKRTSISARGEFNWQVIERAKRPMAIFSIPLRSAQWKKETRNLASVDTVFIQGFSRKLSLLDLFSDLEVSVVSKKIRLIPIHEILNLFSEQKNPSPALTVSTGSLDLNAVFKAAIRRVTVDLDYSTPHFELTYNGGKTRLMGEVQTHVNVFTSRRKGYEFELGKTFSNLKSIRIMNLGEEAYTAENWKVDLALEGGRFTTEPLFNLDGDFQLKMTDLKLPIRFIVPENFFAKLGTFLYPMRNFSGAGALHIDHREIGLRDFKATTSNGPIHGALISKEGEPSMAFVFSLGMIKMCLAQKENDVNPGIHVISKIEECETAIKSYNERRY